MKIEVFENNEFGAVRILKDEKGEPLFVAKDVCDILGYANSRDAIKDNVDVEDIVKLKEILKSSQELLSIKEKNKLRYDAVLINESGLYSLILRSKKPAAKQFKRWVTSEVLPTIRKTGGFVDNSDLFVETYLPFADNNTKLLFKQTLEVVRQQNEVIKQQQTKIQQDKPKVEFAEAVAQGVNAVKIQEWVKAVASSEKIVIGRNKAFACLRNAGYLMENNEPYQRYIDNGYFEVKETPVVTPKGIVNKFTTLITGKGQINLLHILKECANENN